MIEPINTRWRAQRLPHMFWLLGVPILTSSAWAQGPVKWKAELTPVTLHPGQTGLIRLSAKIDDTWHIYAPSTPAGGPFATQVKLAPDALLAQAGKISQPKPISKRDEGFGILTEYFEHSVTFSIPVKLKPNAKSGTTQIQVVFQPCSPRSCLPPETLTVPVVFKVATEPSRSVTPSKPK